jgi:hypothetical protein
VTGRPELPAREPRARASVALAALAVSAAILAAASPAHGSAAARPPACVVPGAAKPGDCYEPGFPIRAAFYYPWFPQAWRQQGLDPFTHYTPALGLYASADATVIRQHLRELSYGGFQAGLSSWWGQRAPSDRVFAKLLAVTNGARSKFRWAVYYEPEGQGDPPVARLVADLRYIRDHYRWNRAYLRIGKKFVVFVYADERDAGGMAARWRQANAQIGNAAYVDLKVFPGYRDVSAAAQSWHQYAPAHADDDRPGASYTISPGFFKAGEQTPRLDRDLARWKTSVAAMVASRAPWQLVTTFNEWGEGTAVEPASEWGSSSGYGVYLDVLHEIR